MFEAARVELSGVPTSWRKVPEKGLLVLRKDLCRGFVLSQVEGDKCWSKYQLYQFYSPTPPQKKIIK